MRNLIASVLVVSGLMLAVTAAAVVSVVFGVAVAGASLVAVGVLTFDREAT